MKVSVVIPAYNEAKRLGPFLQSVAAWRQRHPQAIAEILVVDDGSRDATAAVARQYERKLGRIKILVHPVNRGKGAAVQTGVMAAKGDYIVFIDADGATPISELSKMIAALEQAPIAIGNRWMRGAKTQRHSFLRQLAGWTYRTYMRLFGLGSIDTMCGFKGYHRAVARKLFASLLEERWLFDAEIAYRAVRAGYTVKNIPIRWESKDGSKLSTTTLIATAFQIWPLIRRIKRSA